ncbi:rab-GTPase-TBC domain-containing protein [Radiomyces spectabilis]|uniref:rab-GTPase-TBC domain-containing protein n=1 Tax=Radiomyces spectabilis TaxID=64574 RepID=UPI00221EF3DE|nr:rab-GTPase-TBC domain-containing protein [Radiomyces spectabilis]KAI8370357.1 rab-GTPase-TBC domain-containing protein [Radiomyces spectabilis]
MAATTTNALLTTTMPLKLAPEVLDRLRQLQDADRPVSVDEILMAANLDHLAQPTASKSADMRQHIPPPPQQQPRMEKSYSTTMSLAERRRVPVSPEKLQLFSALQHPKHNRKDSMDSTQSFQDRVKRLEEENAKLPPQDSEAYLVARLERQNALLNADPKSVCIESNRLKAEFTTIRNLVTDNTFSPNIDHEQSIHALIAKSPLLEEMQPDETDVDWEFWQYLVEDFPTAAAKLPHLVSAKLRHGGIPHRLRSVIWQSMSQSASMNLEAIYNNLKNEKSPYDRVIKRDLSRTFPNVDMFKADGGEGQQAMGRLLKAYSVYDSQVGYCQGLAFLVGPLLMTMPEKQAFCVFVRLMETYDMRTMFTLNMEGLHLRLHQFQSLLAQFCPRLDAHLKNYNIHPAMYASQWYLTLFAYTFPISLVLRIYDLVFAEGAVETITRVAIAVMRKNEEKLLIIQDFEQLMMYLSSRKLYDVYNANPEAVISDTMSLSATITKEKMDSIATTHQKELEEEKSTTHQVIAVRLGLKKRDSWFPSWNSQGTAATKSPSVEKSCVSSSVPTTPTSPTPSMATHPQINTVPMLHQQIEDLVTALSQLQKDHSQLNEDLMSMKMREMDHETEYAKLIKKNSQLERRLKKYKIKLASSQVSSPTLASPLSGSSTNRSDESEDSTRLAALEQEDEFRAFVESLSMTGDFGQLIAGALTSQRNSLQGTPQSQSQPEPIPVQHLFWPESEGEEEFGAVAEGEDKEVTANAATQTSETSITMKNAPISGQAQEELPNGTSMHDVTSELVSYKLANFEMGQKYEQLCHTYEATLQQLKQAQEGQNDLVSKIMDLQHEIEMHQAEKEGILDEREKVQQENDDLNEKIMASKKTCADLQMEKLALISEVEGLEKRVRELETEKQEYLMPRGSFTEEVFAAHRTLFGPKPEMNRRHTLQLGTTTRSEYENKYIESDLRCRELEKLLAEAKVKLVEYEASSMTTSPRSSLQQQRRASSYQHKRASSILAVTNEQRRSTDSMMSTNSSSFGTVSKRSSMYSRVWTAFSTPASSVAMKSPTRELYDEPHQAAAI